MSDAGAGGDTAEERAEYCLAPTAWALFAYIKEVGLNPPPFW